MAAPALTVLFVIIVGDDSSSTEATLGYIAGWTLFAYLIIGLTWLDLRRGRVGWFAYVGGVGGVLLALSLTWAGGALIAPALALAVIAASVTPAGRVARGRATGAAALLLLSLADYVWILDWVTGEN